MIIPSSCASVLPPLVFFCSLNKQFWVGGQVGGWYKAIYLSLRRLKLELRQRLATWVKCCNICRCWVCVWLVVWQGLCRWSIVKYRTLINNNRLKTHVLFWRQIKSLSLIEAKKSCIVFLFSCQSLKSKISEDKFIPFLAADELGNVKHYIGCLLSLLSVVTIYNK